PTLFRSAPFDGGVSPIGPGPAPELIGPAAEEPRRRLLGDRGERRPAGSGARREAEGGALLPLRAPAGAVRDARRQRREEIGAGRGALRPGRPLLEGGGRGLRADRRRRRR